MLEMQQWTKAGKKAMDESEDQYGWCGYRLVSAA